MLWKALPLFYKAEKLRDPRILKILKDSEGIMKCPEQQVLFAVNAELAEVGIESKGSIHPPHNKGRDQTCPPTHDPTEIRAWGTSSQFIP